MEITQNINFFVVDPKNNRENFNWVQPNDFKFVFSSVLQNISNDYPDELKVIDDQEGNKKSLLFLTGIDNSLKNRHKISRKVDNVFVNLTEIMEIEDCLQLNKHLEQYRSVLDQKLKEYRVKVDLKKRDLGNGADFYFQFKLPNF